MTEREVATDISSATENYLSDLDEQSGTELGEGGEQSASPNSDPSSEQSAIELDKVEKFKYKGKEYTTKKLDEYEGLQSEFTKKSKEAAEYKREREFATNVHVDLAKVKQNPALAEQFKSIYPKHYHALVDLIKAQEAKKEQTNESSMDPKFLDEFNGMKSEMQSVREMKEVMYQQQVEASSQKLVAIETEMATKYPLNHEKAQRRQTQMVYAQVQSLIDSEQLDPKKITSDTWNTIYKDVHDDLIQLSKIGQKETFNKVKSANQRASSIGRGGSPPSDAPRTARTIKEATDMWVEDVGKR